MKKIIHLMAILSVFACETVIEPKLEQPAEIIVIDAWITQKLEPQTIHITRSQSYFDNSSPEMIRGAAVYITDLENDTVYPFEENDTAYVWVPTAPFGESGHTNLLTVTMEEATFMASALLGRVPLIDSIVFKPQPEDFNILEDYYAAEFFATDFEGPGDTYWIRAWKNGALLNKPSEINIAYDAGFAEGQGVDGKLFHQTIRRDFINPLKERPDRANYYFPPYDAGDSIYIEIHSLDPAAYAFLSAVKQQTDRPGGFSELFATPLANVPTNIRNIDPASNALVGGFFNVSAYSSGGAKLTESPMD